MRFLKIYDKINDRKKVQKMPKDFCLCDLSPVVKISQRYYAKRWPLNAEKDTDA